MNWGAKRTDYFAADYFAGMELAYPELWQRYSGDRNSAALMKRSPDFDRVAVIVSGGAASGPLFPGYVGEGLADAAVGGGPYGAPNAYCLYEVGKYLGGKKGVFFLYNNFAGDYLNNDMAQELLEMEGINSAGFAATDDIASAMGEPRENRCGRSGIALLIKIAGKCAKQGMPPEEIRQAVEKANARLGTLSMTADFDKGEIIYGGGFSGEPGVRRETHMDMERTVKEAADMLLGDLRPASGERLLLMVNRQRYTSYSDGYLAGKMMHEYLSGKQEVLRLRIANYSNIIDTYGFDFTVLCADKELEPYLSETVFSDSFAL